ncbi:hypothetical protein BST91_01325 [Nonlabens tegetincola]|uniref:hypothetical protein n=1 Tax=Nonlabens tegetincola TaxID=323273 RepID=UPI000A204E2F|nr:hypothetical protein [Nonlabens tegetincola]ARN70388.1 hypothetical protein BST91_01325 [Nonlabens tegetincola]
MTIDPNGLLSYEKFESDLFNQNEYYELCSIYDNDNNIEFIVKDDIGNINIIKRTNNFTLPEFEKINDTLKKKTLK